MGNVLEELARAELDPSDLGGRDPEFIERYARPFCTWLRNTYFRTEHEGLEHLPRDLPFIVVSTHSGGPMLPDVWPMLATWWHLYSPETPAYALVHDAVFRVPVVRNAMIKLGALRASRSNAEKVIRAGGMLAILPGGDAEALRSYRHRNRVDFRGHTFFVELALRHGVPVVPVVNVGGHEVYFTLLSSRRLANWSGIARLARVKTVHLTVGLPWAYGWAASSPISRCRRRCRIESASPSTSRKIPSSRATSTTSASEPTRSVTPCRPWWTD